MYCLDEFFISGFFLVQKSADYFQNVKPQHKPYPHSCGYLSQGPIDMLSAAVDGFLRLGISALSITVQLESRGFKHAFDHCINYCHGPFVGSVSYLFMGIEPIAM
jgi:hypothetical protein